MSHNIEHYTYPVSVSKNTIESELQAYAKKATWQEGGGGLPSRIRWFDDVCVDYNSAMEFIEKHDGGWYDQIAVQYREYPKSEPSKAFLSLVNRRKTEQEKYSAYVKAHSVSTFKAEFVGCPKCGSKLKRELLRGESCPLCRAELRSKTTIETLERYSKNIAELDKQIGAEEKKQNEKNIKKSTIKWLVKIEYHT